MSDIAIDGHRPAIWEIMDCVSSGKYEHRYQIKGEFGWKTKMKEYDVNIGVLTVPIEIAQKITDTMVAGGIKAVWNFTPFRIRVPEDIVVQNTSLYAHLAVMFNRLNFNEIR